MSFIKSAMTTLSNPEQRKFYLALAAVFILAAILRFYHLGEINHIVFDEVYFPDYGYSYLAGKEFFHVHPPLYSYITAASIWLYYQLPWVEPLVFSQVQLSDLNALSYRWMNATFGSLLTVVVGFAAYRLTHVRTFAVIAAFLVAIDGSLAVDSRFGMNNPFLVLFGFLGVWAAAKAHRVTDNKRRWFALAGFFLGCCLCIKWNGLGYILALIALLICALIVIATDRFRPAKHIVDEAQIKKKGKTVAKPAFLSRLKLPFKLWEYAVYLAVLPALVYSVLWIPDRMFNTNYTFVGIHQQILGYHSGVKSDEHPYCSKWYGWTVMKRPMSYYFQTRSETDAAGKETKYFTDIHLFGNPAVYWLSTLAIIVMFGQWLRAFWRWFSVGDFSKEWLAHTAILLGFFANLLPWALINRCVFFYHYQSASVFGFLACAWYLNLALKSTNKWIKWAAIAIVATIVAAFIFWLPLMLGIELTAEGFYQRMWFRSWI